MKKALTLVLSLLVGISFAANQEVAADVIQIKAPSVKATTINIRQTKILMDVVNTGSQSHTVIAVVSPVAKKVQLHKTTKQKNHSMMTAVKDIKVPAHRGQKLTNSGLHIMLIGLTKQLTAGQEVPVTLVFEDGSEITVYARASV